MNKEERIKKMLVLIDQFDQLLALELKKTELYKKMRLSYQQQIDDLRNE